MKQLVVYLSLMASAMAMQSQNFETTVQSVVSIHSSTFGGDRHFGTGFYIGEGDFLTNNHLVVTKGDIFVKFRDGSRYFADLVKSDGRYDLALLHVENFPKKKKLKLHSRLPELYEQLYTIGHPDNLMYMSVRGEVSGIVREFRGVEGAIHIVAINMSTSGSSGSPVLDMNNRVVGIITRGSTLITLIVPTVIIEEFLKEEVKK